MTPKILSCLPLALLLCACGDTDRAPAPAPPNVLLIYADDLGYGDLSCQNPEGKIRTVNLDRLAAGGMRFTDAHSSSGICSPSRFALLTGMYHWRRQHDIVNSFGPPMFRETDVTLPQTLKNAGYETACIGKWHLGWDWQFNGPPTGEVMQWGQLRTFYRPEDVVLDGAIAGGPLDRGFDHYFGDGTINFPPYAWVNDDHFLLKPTAVMDIDSIGYAVKEGNWEFRAGPKVPDWNPYKVLPTLADRATSWLATRRSDRPFFLYFALPSPHAPIIPNDAFDGASDAGPYGDFVVQTDYVVGELLQALKASGQEDNTIVVFSSDNGPERYAYPRALAYDHFSMGPWRGLKRDVWEGGHRVPFIIKWPGVTAPGSVSEEVVSQVDLMATLCAAAGAELPGTAAPDSYDLSPILRGRLESPGLREATIQNTWEDVWAVRRGDWLYLDAADGGHSGVPEDFAAAYPAPTFEEGPLLFNLRDDPGQTVNLHPDHPDITGELAAILERYRTSGCSARCPE